jgi:hypothetical protein
MKIIMGDFNAKVGKESWAKTVVVGHSLHDERNGNGVRLISCAVHQQMTHYFNKRVYMKEHRDHET